MRGKHLSWRRSPVESVLRLARRLHARPRFFSFSLMDNPNQIQIFLAAPFIVLAFVICTRIIPYEKFLLLINGNNHTYDGLSARQKHKFQTTSETRKAGWRKITCRVALCSIIWKCSHTWEHSSNPNSYVNVLLDADCDEKFAFYCLCWLWRMTNDESCSAWMRGLLSRK